MCDCLLCLVASAMWACCAYISRVGDWSMLCVPCVLCCAVLCCAVLCRWSGPIQSTLNKAESFVRRIQRPDGSWWVMQLMPATN